MLNSTTVGWMPEPQGRGTIGLVWSCLATIFICTWSTIHFNVPEPTNGMFERALDQCFYMILGLFAPEWLTYLAIAELVKAWEVRRRCPEWSLKRCFFLAMGGFAVRPMAGDASRSFILVDPLVLLDLFEQGKLAWPQFEDSEIDARTQGDGVIKFIALSQLIWFIAQIIARAASSCTITTLELFTLSNVWCSVITFIVWWNKPYCVRVPIILDTPTSYSFKTWDADFVFRHADLENMKSILAGICVGISFGAIHVIGWRFHFPSEIERLLWRISTVGITILSMYLPLVSTGEVYPYILKLALRPLEAIVFMRNYVLVRRIVDGIVFLPLCLYAIFRLYILVEMFAALRNVPQDVYTTVQWTQYFPALG